MKLLAIGFVTGILISALWHAPMAQAQRELKVERVSVAPYSAECFVYGAALSCVPR